MVLGTFAETKVPRRAAAMGRGFDFLWQKTAPAFPALPASMQVAQERHSLPGDPGGFALQSSARNMFFKGELWGEDRH